MSTDSPEEIRQRMQSILNDNKDSMKTAFDKLEALPPKLTGVPVIPLRDMVVFPGLNVPITIERDFNRQAADKAEKSGDPVLFITQKDSNAEEITRKNLYNVGVLGIILKVLELPDGTITALVRLHHPAKMLNLSSDSNDFHADVQRLEEIFPKEKDEQRVNVLLPLCCTAIRRCSHSCLRKRATI